MEINQLKYFKAVADTGKIVVAAELMFVTPPAISASLTALEKELGMTLFVRQGNRLVLNRQGEIFLEYVNHILHTLSDAKTNLAESLTETANQIVVGITASNLLVDLISAFAASHPQIPLSTVTVNLKYDHPAGLNPRASFLFAAEGELPEDYIRATESVYLFDDTPVLMVSPEHPFAKQNGVSAEELAKEKLIWSRANANVYDGVLNFLIKKGITEPVFSMHNQMVCHSLVSHNAGVVVTTAHSRNQVSSDFVFVPIIGTECRWSYRLYWKKDRKLTTEDQIFLKFIKTFYDL